MNSQDFSNRESQHNLEGNEPFKPIDSYNEHEQQNQAPMIEEQMNHDDGAGLNKDNIIKEPKHDHQMPLIEAASPDVRYAGFWMRFWAYLLDVIVIGSVVRLFIKPVLRLMDVSVYDTGFLAPITIISGAIFFLYFILMTKYFGQTLGKMVFGLKVIDLKGSKPSWATIIFREFIGRFISGSMFLLKFGYLLVGFLPKKQGLHDLFADTTVIHER